ncbi:MULTISPECIES: ATP-binding cassette domain-containing protein [Streptomyces]|uniref:ATP-binding cassette domain-containing protein n=1 Tax=Streptomyces fuscus TaxID=3048495 RepID=A0ABT7J1F1_9ACTN|nr:MULTISPECIES: ATP-binding cassette domain-containing protein [Streptomyces]MCM1971623.1 ATP-binding cassette domain-containing protein [Streptomyces sp. G1]MDL2078684.1 ATP-binding cassette domain-containing protein [Streptomyces fuscus]SBT90109.1 ABC-2 type transport system ATP-binding protein/heme exporter protein A [Streptomyces sp. DI166]
MIDIKNLVVRRGEECVLRDFDAHVPEGTSVRVTGPNGSGKSTLLRVIAGLTAPDAGQVTVAGHPPADPAVRALRGFVQEPPPLYEHLTADEQLCLVAGVWRLRARDLRDRAAALGLGDRFDVLVGELSLGQRKKLGYLCATAHEPRLVLLDEPFNGLDAQAEQAVRDDLARWRADGRTLVLVSHSDASVAGLVDDTLTVGADA